MLPHDRRVPVPPSIGRYAVERVLGSGAFAVVWLGHDRDLDDRVAIKVLSENWTHQMDIRDRFVEEARVLRRARSERVVQVFDIGELPDGRPYFVMSYADRGSLADRADRTGVATALRYGADIALGVADLHRVGIMHRDIKPSNVLFRSDGGGLDRLVIADLGLSKRLAEASGFTLAAGTPGFMAPEQADGLGLDHRVDVYGIGATVYHLLTGVKPGGAAPSSLRPGLPRGTDEVLSRALATDPADRWPTALELAKELAALAAAGPAAAEPPRPAARPDASSAGPRPVVGPDASSVGPRPVVGPDASSVGPHPVDASLVGPHPAVRPNASAAGPRAVDVPSEAEETTRIPAVPRAAPRRRTRLWWLAAVAVLVAAAAALIVVRPWEPGAAPEHVDIADDQGRIRLTVPTAWAGERQGGGWQPSDIGATGEPGPGVAVAADLDRWRDHEDRTPGVFVGLSGDAAVPDLVLTLRHDGCRAGKPTERAGALTGQVVRWRCPNDVTFDEAGLRTEGGTAVYVQIKQDTREPDRADEILAGLRVDSGR
jgi:hypothetical protein